MPVMMVQQDPTLTRELYDESVRRLTGGKDRLESRVDWPVPGLILHATGEGPDGFVVVDVWESEEAFARFGETLGPILQELDVQGQPQVFPAHTVVT